MGVKKQLLLSVCLCIVGGALARQKSFRYNTSLTVPQLVTKYGYRVEVHTVQTSDGYLLELHRILARGASSSAPVALLQHAMLGSSATWVLAGPKVGLAYMLADRGYDVWLGNSRGTPNSRKHTSLSPDDEGGAYWQFSWHEMGVFDLPAIIDYILDTTSQTDLFYIGHCQGATELVVMLSERPEYNSKITGAFMLAPAVYLRYSTSPFLHGGIIKIFENFGGPYELISETSFLKKAANHLCRDGSAFYRPLCLAFLFVNGGFDSEQLDERLVPMIFAHIPASSSQRQIEHYYQVHASGRLQQFDFGVAENLVRYSSSKPPEYNMGNITCPMALYYGLNDPFCAPKDMDFLYSQLANPIEKFIVSHRKWNHIDFLWARDVKVLVYDHLMSSMDRLSGREQRETLA